MNKSSFVIIFLFLAIVFALPYSAHATTKVSINPGSFFYFFDTTFENINLFFTFSPEKKAQKALEYADERLAEVEVLTKEKDTNAVETAIAGYENNIVYATEKSKQVKNKGKAERLLTLITDSTSKHQEILFDVLNNTPLEAKKTITEAIEANKNGREKAIKQIVELNGEVEQLKQKVAELQAKDKEREKVIEELNKRRSESTSTTIQVFMPVASSQPQIEEKKNTNIITPPNETIVGINTNENILHQIKEVPSVTDIQPAPQIFSHELEDGLNRLYIKLTLNFIKTASDHLVNIAALSASKFNILIDGRDRCTKDYDNNIAEERKEGERRIISELEARRGFGTNSASIRQMRDSLENAILDLQKAKEKCLLYYPLSDLTIEEKITQEVMKLDNLYKRVSVGTNSITEAVNMLQEYNSIEARIYSFGDYIPLPLRPVSIFSAPKPMSPIGSFSCAISPIGGSYSCYDSFSNTNTSCQLSPIGNSWGCRNSNGSNIRCEISPTGESVECSSY